jgi:flagellar protein FlaH
MTTDTIRGNLILTGVREVDEKIGGGIPMGSLCLIEGQSGAGKSVLSQHLTYGALKDARNRVAYYTTENTVKSLITQMDSLSLSPLDYFLAGALHIYPLSIRKNMQNTERRFRNLILHFSQLPRYIKLILVDSITLLLAHSDQVPIIDFFSACKDLCDEDRTVVLVAHSYAFEDEILSRTRSLCDAHLRLKLEQVSDRLVKVLEVLKVRGAEKATGDIVSFEVEPKMGIRIIPLSKAKV